MAARTSFSDAGAPFVTRTAESPRPMPQTVRLPYISFSVAKTDAVTVQSRVAGFVTNGPTMMRVVSARIAEGMKYGSCQNRCETKVQTGLKPWASAGLAGGNSADA